MLREGLRRKVRGYTFFLSKRASGGARLGVLVSRRESRSAVERNRLKRRIREAFRLEQHALQPLDILVRPPAGMRSGPQMVRDLRKMLVSLSP